MKEHQLTIHVQKTTMDINISPIHIQRTVGDMIRLPRCKTISSRHIIYKRLWGIYIFCISLTLSGNPGTAAARAALPIPISVCSVFVCQDNGIWLPGFGIFNVWTVVDACGCTRGLYGHRKRVCTWSWLGEKSCGETVTRTRHTLIPTLYWGESQGFSRGTLKTTTTTRIFWQNTKHKTVYVHKNKYTERHDDRYGIRVPSNKRKIKASVITYTNVITWTAGN